MSRPELRRHLSFAMDGVILTMPPEDPIDRHNYCHLGETHMWRRPNELASPALSGADKYGKQVPLSRAIPLWGGIAETGFAPVLEHEHKKLTSEEWAAAVDSGKLESALLKLHPERRRGPWHVLCDNESFLRAPRSRTAHDALRVRLWQIPARSPDLNPVEKYWGWLRRQLRAQDLADLAAKRPVLIKAAYRKRIKATVSSARSRRVARAYVRGLRKVCLEVIRRKGAATRG
jgi:hypothetical protein